MKKETNKSTTKKKVGIMSGSSTKPLSKGDTLSKVYNPGNIHALLAGLDVAEPLKIITIVDEKPMDPYCIFGFVSNLIDISKKDVRIIEFKDDRERVVITMYD